MTYRRRPIHQWETPASPVGFSDLFLEILAARWGNEPVLAFLERPPEEKAVLIAAYRDYMAMESVVSHYARK